MNQKQKKLYDQIMSKPHDKLLQEIFNPDNNKIL